MPAKSYFLLACLAVVGPSPVQAQQPPKSKSPLDQIDGYKRHVIEGFTLLVSDETLKVDTAKYKRAPLDVLELELKTVVRIMPAKTVDALRKVLIWVEWDEATAMRNGRGGTAVAVYAGGHQAQLFREGKHPLKAKAVTVLRMKSLTEEHQPNRDSGRCVLLHELAHAVNDVIVGWENPALVAAYRQALERKLYDKDQYVSTNEAEFFAELSCAYFDQLHHFPQTREDLKTHDPVTHKLMEGVWGKDAKRVETKPLPLTETNGADEFDLTVKPAALVVGKPLLGPESTPKDWAGKVLVVGFFGGSDKAVLSRYAALHAELATHGVQVIVGPAYVAAPETVKRDAEDREVPFAVMDRVLLRETGKPGARSQPAAHTLVFDEAGVCVYRGSGHQAAPHVRAAIWKGMLAKASPPQLKGLSPLLGSMESGQPFADVLAKTVSAVLSGDPALATAARPILTELTAPAKATLDEATATAKTDPLAAYLLAETIPPRYKRTKLASQADALMQRLKQSPLVVAELRARPLFDQLKRLDTVVMTTPGAFTPKGEIFRENNATSINQMIGLYDQLKRKFPTAKATESAAQLLRKYGG